jgi:hypothetical protein
VSAHCTTGTFSEPAGESACLRCTPGTYLDTEGHDAQSDCILCGKGKFSGAAGASAAATCVDCSTGKYSNDIGMSACLLCGMGKYSLPYETFPYPVGVQTNYSTSLFSGLSCTVRYDARYSDTTTYANIETCKSAGGPGSWIAMGSKSSSSETSFDVLAFIPASSLVPSESTSMAYGPINGVYWYYYDSFSVGFASSSSIKFNSFSDTEKLADALTTDCNKQTAQLDFVPNRAKCCRGFSWRLAIRLHG